MAKGIHACVICGRTPPQPVEVAQLPSCGRVKCGKVIQEGVAVPAIRVESGVSLLNLTPYRVVSFDYPDSKSGQPLNRVVFLIPPKEGQNHLVRGFDAGRQGYRTFNPDKVG